MNKKLLFSLGMVVASSEALRALRDLKLSVTPLLERHQTCDERAMDALDRASNLRAIQSNGRVVSGHRLSPVTTLWIVTYLGRSMTQISLTSLFGTSD